MENKTAGWRKVADQIRTELQKTEPDYLLVEQWAKSLLQVIGGGHNVMDEQELLRPREVVELMLDGGGGAFHGKEKGAEEIEDEQQGGGDWLHGERHCDGRAGFEEP